MKSAGGNFFEDFRVGQLIRHATPRTITTGDTALYTALYGSRFAPQSSDELARALGYPRAPVDDLLVFHVVFGKSVPDISLNAIANLGYAECCFRRPVFPGDTLSASSEVIGLRQNSSGDSGIVWVRTSGTNQTGATVLDYVRWVMVRKRDKASPAPQPVVPVLAARVAPAQLGQAIPPLNLAAWDPSTIGSPWSFADYRPGEVIDHVDGFTIEEAEHQMATRLYQNTARVHFNAHAEASSRLGRRLVYGGVVMSIARALSFNGLGPAFQVSAINAGSHTAPCVAGDTIYASSEIVECADIPGRSDGGALRVHMTASAVSAAIRLERPTIEKNTENSGRKPVLELDVWLAAPRI